MTKNCVFASGNGSNFQVIAEQFPVEFVFQITGMPMCSSVPKSLEFLPMLLNSRKFESKVDYEGAIVELLDEHEIDLVCLAGYMKIVGPTFIGGL